MPEMETIRTTYSFLQAQAASDGFDFLKEPRSGVEFPKTVRTWCAYSMIVHHISACLQEPLSSHHLLWLECRREDVEPMRLLGVGCRQKKFLMLNVQVCLCTQGN